MHTIPLYSHISRTKLLFKYKRKIIKYSNVQIKNNRRTLLNLRWRLCLLQTIICAGVKRPWIGGGGDILTSVWIYLREPNSYLHRVKSFEENHWYVRTVKPTNAEWVWIQHLSSTSSIYYFYLIHKKYPVQHTHTHKKYK